MNNQRRIVWDAANVSTANGIVAGTQLLETIVLARLLPPQDIGLIAIVAVIVGFVRSFADAGVGYALIHFQDTSRRVFSSLYWLLLACGIAIFCAFLFGGPLVSFYLPQSPLSPLFGLIGLNFLLYSLGGLYQYSLQKEMRFRRIAYAEGAARCAGTLTVIVLAIKGAGVVSYVAGQLVYNGVKSAALLLAGFRRQPLMVAFDVQSIRAYLRFGMFQAGERVVTFFAANIDYIIIGKFLGVRELGFYKVAYELVTVPLRIINPIFTTLAVPRFAKKQHDDMALREGVFSMLRVVAVITFPLLFGLAATANVFIPVVYGAGWDPAIPLLWLLTAMGLLKIIGNVGGSVIIAKGAVKRGFIWSGIIAAGNSIAFFFAVRFGAGAVAVAYSAVSFLYLFLSFPSYYRDTIGLSPGEYIRSFSLPTALSAAMGAAVYGAHLALGGISMQPYFELIVLMVFGASVYALLNVALFRKEMIELLRGIRPS